VGSKAAAFALILRLFTEAFLPALDDWQIIIALLAALTMTVGNLVALTQSNIKRLLAYSSIGQAGYLLVGLAAIGHVSQGQVVASVLASNGLILHLAGYAVANLAAFLCVITYYNHTGKEEINDFAGLADRAPFMALVMASSFFSLAGLPIFAGFITKFYIFTAAAQQGLLWLAAIAIVNSLISLYYYLTVIRQMYINPALTSNGTPYDTKERPPRIPVSMLTSSVLTLLWISTVLIGIYPEPLMNAIEHASNTILPP
jgi:NADH-quinone oxidoreductase subunit N